MSIGLFTDKKCQPTEAQVHAAIGARLALWQALIQAVREQYVVQEDFKFLYGKSYGWAVRFRVKSQVLTSLFPAQGGFVAQVNLSPDAIEKALAMEMSKNVQLAIARAHPYPEGRWLFIPVETEEDLNGVRQLIEMRAQAKRLLKQ
ncbi:MAG: DUF3788 family protein [Chloroflexota bacterium]